MDFFSDIAGGWMKWFKPQDKGWYLPSALRLVDATSGTGTRRYTAETQLRRKQKKQAKRQKKATDPIRPQEVVAARAVAPPAEQAGQAEAVDRPSDDEDQSSSYDGLPPTSTSRAPSGMPATSSGTMPQMPTSATATMTATVPQTASRSAPPVIDLLPFPPSFVNEILCAMYAKYSPRTPDALEQTFAKHDTEEGSRYLEP